MLDFDDGDGSPERPRVAPRDREPPLMDHAAGWKESAFTWEMGELVLARIAAGETVKQITDDPRMPSYATVYHWTRVIEEFGEAWQAVRRARCIQAKAADAIKAMAPPRRHWVSGKKSTYTRAQAEAVCAAIRDGASLSEVVRTPGMPSFKKVYRWLKRQPEFEAMYVAACDGRDRWLEFQGVLIAEETTPASFRANRERVARLDGRRGRMRPKKYRVMVVVSEGPAR
ncbi:MAG: hypothetical protein E7812_02995 [Phenylobacterium sp.]|nr:MAG: hypothetical protein E7812_02995 [Phenylobacterium sp.]